MMTFMVIVMRIVMMIIDLITDGGMKMINEDDQ